jgi:hypothetical protein
MNRSIRVRACAAVLTAAFVTVAGCGPANGLNLVKVSGKVTYKGQPVKNGTVFFMPDEGKKTVGPAAVGSITSDGSYTLSTESPGDGVVVGEHRVGLTGVEATPVGDSGPSPEPDKDAGGFMAAKSKAAKAVNRPKPKEEEELFKDKGGKLFRYVIPMKLSNPNQSGITVKIDRSRTVNFDVDESGNVRISP